MQVLDTNKEYYIFDKIEAERTLLKKNNRTIMMEDYGAGTGSDKKKNKIRKISEIASTSLSRPSKCRILFNLVLHYNFRNILELGTSLGISSSYLAAAHSKNHVITLEGDKNIADVAAGIHHNIGLSNINIVHGPFDETLANVLHGFTQIDIAFIDGHHQKEPTLLYFDTISKLCHEHSIIVIDDIYWSPGMQSAWENIIKRDNVSLTIDLFDIGIVFFKKGIAKQNLCYLPFHYKPWKIGLFG